MTKSLVLTGKLSYANKEKEQFLKLAVRQPCVRSASKKLATLFSWPWHMRADCQSSPSPFCIPADSVRSM